LSTEISPINKNMTSLKNCFTSFIESIDSYELPKRFTFPFYYEPHPLCLLASKELQSHLENQIDWKHNFGLDKDEESSNGKMFGVLLVQNKEGEIGYLAAFSGKLAGANHHSKFVPPIFDMLTEEGFFNQGQIELSSIHEQVRVLERNLKLKEAQHFLVSVTEQSLNNIEEQRVLIRANRKVRKEQRQKAEKELSPEEHHSLKEQLSKISVREKLQLEVLKKQAKEKINKAQEKLEIYTTEIDYLKNTRKELSGSLQQQLFDQYHFLDINGNKKSLCNIFSETPQLTPPAAAGECAAPKLLQYAFENNLKPLAMAEFWWGESPKSAIRKHGQYYPACQGKCQPILGHMLQGMEVDENPLLNNPAEGKSIDIIYEDDELLVINKPAEFLSVPGKTIQDSVYQRMKIQFPKATGPLIVHRLDMSTSGLMLIAKTKDTHKNLQRQFIKRTVKKRYVALLDGLVNENEGIIDLPLRLDIDDRPRQLVCYEHGKSARTKWKVIERKNNQTKIHFYPITGRTHQLRVHSAHSTGLNIPIIGDDLYGTKSNRLHLHAESVEFEHPISKDLMSFQVKAEF
jgi:tRNA pseudouridine32 synthase / 23S rRNA pseudouridine746 synthase